MGLKKLESLSNFRVNLTNPDPNSQAQLHYLKLYLQRFLLTVSRWIHVLISSFLPLLPLLGSWVNTHWTIQGQGQRRFSEHLKSNYGQLDSNDIARFFQVQERLLVILPYGFVWLNSRCDRCSKRTELFLPPEKSKKPKDQKWKNHWCELEKAVSRNLERNFVEEFRTQPFKTTTSLKSFDLF